MSTIIAILGLLLKALSFITGFFKSTPLEEAYEKADDMQKDKAEVEKELIAKEVEDQVDELRQEDADDFFKREDY